LKIGFSGRGNHFSDQGKEKISRAEEKIGRGKHFSGLFFLPPCLGKHFFGKEEDFSGLGNLSPCKAEEKIGSLFRSFPRTLADNSNCFPNPPIPMLTCSACGHSNIDGTQFCEMCGEELLQAAAQTAHSSANDVKCSNCGHLNPPENLACEACGANLKPSAAPFLAPAPSMEATPFDSFVPLAPVAPISQEAGDLKPGFVKLVVEQGQTVGAQFILNDPHIEIGREDEDEDIYPDIDLSDQDAGYVHRKHATLNFDNGHLLVTHGGGANKTRVNNKPLADNTPSEVKLGDKIAFGKVVLRIVPV